jgi:clan AA aspartic protease
MIVGKVANREATIALELIDGQKSVVTEAVIDTGFNGFLTLPADLLNKLNFTFVGHRRATLADGSSIRLDAYLGQVKWHGKPTSVVITSTAGSPLIGMSLLEGNRLTVDVSSDGQVIIELI